MTGLEPTCWLQTFWNTFLGVSKTYCQLLSFFAFSQHSTLWMKMGYVQETHRKTMCHDCVTKNTHTPKRTDILYILHHTWRWSKVKITFNKPRDSNDFSPRTAGTGREFVANADRGTSVAVKTVLKTVAIGNSSGGCWNALGCLL